MRFSEDLGIWNKRKLTKIYSSNLPLVELFMYLTFKDSDWRSKLQKMNKNIEKLNKTSKKKNNKKWRNIPEFNEEQFLLCFGLMIGAAVCTEGGVNLWGNNKLNKEQWSSFAP